VFVRVIIVLLFASVSFAAVSVYFFGGTNRGRNLAESNEIANTFLAKRNGGVPVFPFSIQFNYIYIFFFRTTYAVFS